MRPVGVGSGGAAVSVGVVAAVGDGSTGVAVGSGEGVVVSSLSLSVGVERGEVATIVGVDRVVGVPVANPAGRLAGVVVGCGVAVGVLNRATARVGVGFPFPVQAARKIIGRMSKMTLSGFIDNLKSNEPNPFLSRGRYFNIVPSIAWFASG